MNFKRTGLVVALSVGAGLALFLLLKQDPVEDDGKKGRGDPKPKIAGGSDTSQSNNGRNSPAAITDTPAPETGELVPAVLLNPVSGDITLSSGFSALDANTLAQLRNKVRDAFARLEEIDSRHAEVVQSNLRTDVIIIGKAGEEGQKIKKELEEDLLRTLPKENQAAAKLIVAQVGQQTADFGSKFRAIYTPAL